MKFTYFLKNRIPVFQNIKWMAIRMKMKRSKLENLCWKMPLAWQIFLPLEMPLAWQLFPGDTSSPEEKNLLK